MRIPDASEVAARYDALYHGTGFGDAPRFYEWIAQLAVPPAGGRVLDIGCGGGGALTPLVTRSDVTAVGLDISQVALAQAHREAPGARLVRADGTRLPFADATFDVVLNLGNLEHFTDLEEGIREMRRVLRPAGRAWILLPNLFYSGTLWRVIRGGAGPDHHQPIDRFATRVEWQRTLEADGLRVLRSIPYHKGKWWKRLLPSALAWHFLYEVEPGPAAGHPALPPLTRVRPTE